MKWALIGYGGMGHFHARKLRAIPDVIDIVGVYDIRPERMSLAREEGFFTYDSLQSLLDDPQTELVTVATPNDTHRDLVIACLDAGKNVICEKPVAMNAHDLQMMIDAAHRNNRVFSVHQNRRWDEDFLVIKKIYDENKIGRVFNIESRVHGSRGIPGDWRNTRLQGGGMIYDWGVHMLDQLLQIVKEPVVSTYCTVMHVTNDEVDDGFKAIITFGSGITAHIEVGTSNFVSLPRWYMQGENGTAVIRGWDLDGEIVMVTDWENRDAVPVETAAGLTKTMAPRTDDNIQKFSLPRIASDVLDYYRNIVRTVHGEEQQIVKHDEMMRVVRLMEACFESAERNEVVHTRV